MMISGPDDDTDPGRDSKIQSNQTMIQSDSLTYFFSLSWTLTHVVVVDIKSPESDMLRTLVSGLQ